MSRSDDRPGCLPRFANEDILIVFELDRFVSVSTKVLGFDKDLLMNPGAQYQDYQI